MNIGIIGSGPIGSTLARKLRANGHDVRITNSRGADGVKATADAIGVTAADLHDVVQDVDVIIVAIPLPAIAQLGKGLLESVGPSVVVVDTSNYYPGLRDARIGDIEAGLPESMWVTRELGRPVVKAFNNITSHSRAELGRPQHDPGRLAVDVAGDDARAKQIVMSLVDQVGFDPVDAGSLADSWRQQPATPAYCCDFGASMMRKGLAAAVEGEAPKTLARWIERFKQLPPNASHADLIALNRSLNPLV